MSSAIATPNDAGRFRAIFHGTILLAGSAIVARLLNLGFRFILARHIDVDSYGAFALAASIISYGAVAGTMNLGQAAARFLPLLNERSRGSLMRRLVRIGSTSVLLAITFAIAVALHLGLPFWATALCVVGVASLSTSNVLEGILRGSDRIGFQAANQVIVSCSRLLAALALAVFAAPVLPRSAPLALFVFGLLLGAVFPLLALRRPREFASAAGSTAPTSREIVRFASLLTCANLCTTGVGFLNRLLLSRYASYSDVAHYDNGLLAYSAFQTLLSSFVLASIPLYARLDANAPVEVLGIRRLMPAFLVAYGALAIPEILEVTAPVSNSLGVGDYAPFYAVFLVLLLGFPFEFVFVSISGPLQGRSRVGVVAACAIAAAAASLGTAAALIPRYGVIGACLSTLLNAVVLAFGGVIVLVATRVTLATR